MRAYYATTTEHKNLYVFLSRKCREEALEKYGLYEISGYEARKMCGGQPTWDCDQSNLLSEWGCYCLTLAAAPRDRMEALQGKNINTFTPTQEAQIRKALDRLMQVGTAHICLSCATLESKDDDIEWYTVRAYVPYLLRNRETGEEYRDEKTYEISVGKYPDRRRHVLTALNTSQHALAQAV